MGIIGPRKVVLNDPHILFPAPYKIEDNNNSILDISDIVMIDPVVTGLSHAVVRQKDKDFWGVDQDIKEVSGFIKHSSRKTTGTHQNIFWAKATVPFAAAVL